MTAVRHWTTRNMLDALREYATIDPECPCERYAAWARENHRPSMDRIQHVIGWTRAKEIAGVDLPLTVKQAAYVGAMERWVRSTDDGRDWALNDFIVRIGHS